MRIIIDDNWFSGFVGMLKSNPDLKDDARYFTSKSEFADTLKYAEDLRNSLLAKGVIKVTE